MKQSKWKKAGRIVLTVLAVLIGTLGVLLFTSERWMRKTWPNLNMEELAYQLKAPIAGTSHDLLMSYVRSCALLAVIALVALVLVSIFLRKKQMAHLAFGLTCIAIVREFIGTGAIFGVQILPLADAAAGKGGYVPVTIFILPAGAFLVLAFLVAGMNRLKRHAAQKGKKIAEPQGCGTDCASCGGCGSKVFPTGNEE